MKEGPHRPERTNHCWCTVGQGAACRRWGSLCQLTLKRKPESWWKVTRPQASGVSSYSPQRTAVCTPGLWFASFLASLWGSRAIQTQSCSSLSRPPALGRKATGSSCCGWRAGDHLVGPCRAFAPPRPLPLHRSPAQRHDHFRCPCPLLLPSGRVPGPTRVPVMSQRSIDVLA